MAAYLDSNKLALLLGTDNQARKAAEQYLEAAKKQNPLAFVQCALSLSLSTSIPEPIRVLCLSILRNLARQEFKSIIEDKPITNEIAGGGGGTFIFRRLSASDGDSLRREIFSCIQNENNKLFFMKKVADFLISFNAIQNWDTFVPEVCSLFNNTSNISTMNTCLYLLQKLLETNINPLSDQHASALTTLMTACLQHPNLKTKSLAVQLCFAYAYKIPAESEIPDAMINHCLSVLAETVSNDHEEALSILDSVQNLIQTKGNIFRTVWQNLFQLLGNVIHADAIVDEQIKVVSLDCMVDLILNEKSTFCHTQQCREAVTKVLLTLMTQIDDAYDSSYWLQRPHEDGEFFDEGCTISNLSVSAAHSFSLCSYNFSTKTDEYFLPLCLQFAQEQLSMANWKSQRGGLLVLNHLCLSAPKSIFYGKISLILPAVCSLVSSDSIGVQYAALNCLMGIIQSYSNLNEVLSSNENEEDSNDDEESGKKDRKSKSIQELFPDKIPQVLLQCCQSPKVISNPKLLSLVLNSLFKYFNPDSCVKKIGKKYCKPILEFCDSVLINDMSLIFCREQAALLIANASLFCPRSSMQTYYPRIMTILKTILSFEVSKFQSLIPAWKGIYGEEPSQSLQLDLSMLKCASLEAIALVGKSVGSDFFYNDAVEMLGTLIQFQNSASVDYNDALFIGMLQASARIATVLCEKFSPFIPHVMPPLLKFISSPFSFNRQDFSTLGELDDEDSGRVQNIPEVDQRLTALKCLYQYLLDIPSFLAPFIPEIVKSVVDLLFNNDWLNSDFSASGFAVFYDGIKAFLLYCNQNADSLRIAQAMVNSALETILHLYKICKLNQSESGNELINVQIDGLRQLLLYIVEERSGVRKWQLNIEEKYFMDIIKLLKDEVVCWYSRNSTTDNISEEFENMENDIIYFVMDCFLYISKLCGRLTGADRAFIDLVSSVESFIPLVDGKVNNNCVKRTKELILSIYADAFENVSMSAANSSWPSILITASLRFIDVDDCITSCLQNMGRMSSFIVSAVVNNQSNQDLLSTFSLFFRVLLHASNEWPAESIRNCPRLWNQDEIDDDAQASILQAAQISLFSLCLSLISSNSLPPDFSIPSSMGWPDVQINARLSIRSVLSHFVEDLKNENYDIADLCGIREFHSGIISQARAYNPALYGSISETSAGNLILVLELIIQLLISVGDPDSLNSYFWGGALISESSFSEAKELLKDLVQGKSPFPLALLSANYGQLTDKARTLLSRLTSNPGAL